MAICVAVNAAGFVKEDLTIAYPNCNLALFTPSEIESLKSVSVTSMSALFEQYFAFNPDTFLYIVGFCLVMFATGLATGIVFRLMTMR